jgi:hypothetical protein
MNRYSVAKVIKTFDDPIRRFTTVKYPSILPTSLDIYVYTTQGDRYDTLALTYYNDSSLWWIINRANSNQSSDSLYPSKGAQIRIPASQRIPSIISEYNIINNIV